MDLNDNGSLVALEHLMDEFYNPLTSNSRKHDIERQLQLFKNQPHLSKLCLYFITNTSSQYVTLFALSTLGSVINQQWLSINWSEKNEIRDMLHVHLVQKATHSPHYLRCKYAKLLVDIARHDWPAGYPNFLINIFELLKSETNQLVGLIMLRTTSEEFMGQHACIDGNRKEEITRLLQPYIPLIFEIMTNILESIGNKPRHTSTATPPPSPTHPGAQPEQQHLMSTATYRPDGKALTKEALDTVQHLFTWMPVDQIPNRVVSAIFSFTNRLSYAQDDDDVGVLAISTINEILYRKCTPPGSQDLFTQIFQNSYLMLRDIVRGSIDTLDIAFTEKISELFDLLIKQHFWRFEMEQNFSALEFLSLLFQLTMQIPAVDCYLKCLDVWASFIKQVKPENAYKYSDVFRELGTTLLKKIQFSYNCNQLLLINDCDLLEDNQTEWQIFLTKTIEIIAMVAEFSPLDTFNQALIPWKTSHDVFRRMENAVDHGSFSLIYEISETDKLCYILRDFATLTQTLARLSSMFIDQDNNEIVTTSAPVMNFLVEKLIESASLAISIRFYNVKIGDSRLTQCFVDIHSQILAALKTFLIWMTQTNKLTNQNLKTLVDVTLPILHDGITVPSKIAHSAAHFLLALTNNVFPPTLMVVPLVVQFIHNGPSLKFNENETKYLVDRAISNLLLRPWGDINQEDSTQRNLLINFFFDNLTRDLRELAPNTPEGRVKEVTERLLPALIHIIEFCKVYPGNSKKLLCAAIKPTFDHILNLFPIYVKYPETNNHILNFFITVLATLQPQLGIDCVTIAVQTFLKVSQQNSMSGLEKLLQILQIVVEAPGSSYKTFLPGILQLCMENIYPFICGQINDYPEVFVSLLTLLYSILVHRWQYFYISQVKLGYSPGCSESDAGPDSPQKPDQLLAVINVFGQALIQHDINIFRLSLFALEDLNNKWKLYQKGIFKQELAFKFLNVLIKTLIDKGQDLLAEDIHIAVYNIASVDLSLFFKFLEQFVQSIDGLDAQQGQILLQNFVYNHDKDMPTFVRHLQRFVNEAQNVRLCNRTSV